MKQESQERMTTAERTELARLARLRAKVAKSEVDARVATCLTKFDAQLAASYSRYDKHWATLTAEAEAAVERADAELAKRCRELGIPEAFRPSLDLSWYGRGENGDKDRRAELRRVAQHLLDLQARRGKLEIERKEAQIIGNIVEAGLTSADAKALLGNLPSVQQLVPELALAEVESKVPLPKGCLED